MGSKHTSFCKSTTKYFNKIKMNTFIIFICMAMVLSTDAYNTNRNGNWGRRDNSGFNPGRGDWSRRVNSGFNAGRGGNGSYDNTGHGHGDNYNNGNSGFNNDNSDYNNRNSGFNSGNNGFERDR